MESDLDEREVYRLGLQRDRASSGRKRRYTGPERRLWQRYPRLRTSFRPAAHEVGR